MYSATLNTVILSIKLSNHTSNSVTYKLHFFSSFFFLVCFCSLFVLKSNDMKLQFYGLSLKARPCKRTTLRHKTPVIYTKLVTHTKVCTMQTLGHQGACARPTCPPFCTGDFRHRQLYFTSHLAGPHLNTWDEERQCRFKCRAQALGPPILRSSIVSPFDHKALLMQLLLPNNSNISVY